MIARGSAFVLLTTSRLPGGRDAADDALARDDLVGADLVGDAAGGHDRTQRPRLVRRQEHGARVAVEQRPGAVGDELEHDRQLERGRHLAPDFRERGHLLGPLACLVIEAGVLDGDADVGGDRRQQPLVGSAETALLARALDADDADRAVARHDRHAEPRLATACRRPRAPSFAQSSSRLRRSGRRAWRTFERQALADLEWLLWLVRARPRRSTGSRCDPPPRRRARRRRYRRRRRRASSRPPGRGAAPTSICALIASPTVLIVASSPTRRRVSSMRRPVRSATARLAAIVVTSDTSRSSNAYSRSRFWSEMTPRMSSPTRSGAKIADFAGSPTMWSGCPYSRPIAAQVVGDEQRRPRLDDVLPEAHDGPIRHREAHAALEREREAHDPRVAVVDGDIDDLGVEDVARPLPHQLVHRLHIELGGEALLHAVHDRQLCGAAIGLGQQALRLVEQAGVLEGHAQAGGEGAEQPDVLLAERVFAVEVLERDDAACLVADDERDPDRRLRCLALEAPLPALGLREPEDVVVHHERQALGHDVGADSRHRRASARRGSARRARWCTGSG